MWWVYRVLLNFIVIGAIVVGGNFLPKDPGSFIVFAGITTLLQVQWQWYVYLALVRHLPRPARSLHMLFAFFCLLGPACLKFLPSQNPVTLLSLSVLVSNVWLGLALLSFRTTRKWHKLSRSREAALIVATTCLFAGAALYEGSLPPELQRVDIRLEGLGRNITITHLSDMHLGPVLGEEFCESVLSEVRRLKSDIVILTGDILDAKSHLIPFDPIKSCIARFPHTHGIYYVTGNHEYINHIADDVMQRLRDVGVVVLDNACHTVGSLGINVAGVTDLQAPRLGEVGPDVPKAFRGCNTDLPNLFLAHQPNVEPDITKFVESSNLRSTVIFSGHTHAGQVFPVSIIVYLVNKHFAGLSQPSPKTQVFVSRGTGQWGPRMRLFAKSEIVQVKLYDSKNK